MPVDSSCRKNCIASASLARDMSRRDCSLRRTNCTAADRSYCIHSMDGYSHSVVDSHIQIGLDIYCCLRRTRFGCTPRCRRANCIPNCLRKNRSCRRRACQHRTTSYSPSGGPCRCTPAARPSAARMRSWDYKSVHTRPAAESAR